MVTGAYVDPTYPPASGLELMIDKEAGLIVMG
jgi:hypothetical protein